MQFLESRLLETGDFEAGEALTKYCKLIKANQYKTDFSGQIQKHHILPRAWYKLHNKKLDNSTTNTVLLTVSDHAKAHLFLFQAASNPEVRAQNAAAVRCMCDLFSEELIDEYAEELNRVNLELAQKKSKALAERRAAGLNQRARPVLCVETNQVFGTIKEAQESMHLWIKPVLSGQKESVGGYHFKYYEKDTKEFFTAECKINYFTEAELTLLIQQYPTVGSNIPELLKNHSATSIRAKAHYLGLVSSSSYRNSYNNIPIICLETDQIFKDIYEAGALFTGSRPSKLILNACNGKAHTAYNYHWCWLKDVNRQEQVKSSVESKKVICVNTDTVYDSVSVASKATGVPTSSIYSAIKKPSNTPKLHWAYAEDTDRIQFIKDNYLTAENVYTNYTFNPKRVRCVETGITYPDMTTAAKALGMHGPSHISTACKTGKKSGGYHWEYVS